jgi:hypothetical protein
VWWGPAPFNSSAVRPWLVVSDERRPFSHAECIALALTTQEYAEGITVPDEAWTEGGADVQSYISGSERYGSSSELTRRQSVGIGCWNDIRRELVFRAAKADRDRHREIYDALENESHTLRHRCPRVVDGTSTTI